MLSRWLGCGLADWIGPPNRRTIFCWNVLVVVLAHGGVPCVALDESAICVAGHTGEVFARFQGRCEPVDLEECT